MKKQNKMHANAACYKRKMRLIIVVSDDIITFLTYCFKAYLLNSTSRFNVSNCQVPYQLFPDRAEASPTTAALPPEEMIELNDELISVLDETQNLK